jgi:hypothetical protein
LNHETPHIHSGAPRRFISNKHDARASDVPDGCWNALGDWKIGGDGDLPGDFAQLSSLNFKGSAAAASGAKTVTGSLALPAGDYTFL